MIYASWAYNIARDIRETSFLSQSLIVFHIRTYDNNLHSYYFIFLFKDSRDMLNHST